MASTEGKEIGDKPTVCPQGGPRESEGEIRGKTSHNYHKASIVDKGRADETITHTFRPQPGGLYTEHQGFQMPACEVEAGSVCVSLCEDQFLEGRNYVLSSICWRGALSHR